MARYFPYELVVVSTPMHNKWLGKSISERLEWYTGEIDSLVDYLTGKEQLNDEEISKSMLKKIKDRMQVDQDPELEESGTAGKELQDYLDYYEAVEKASKELPEYGTDRKKWFEKLESAKEKLMDVK